MTMINKDNILKELAEKTSHQNLTGDAREDAKIYFEASKEYVLIDEYDKAILYASKAYTALLASRTKDNLVVAEVIERTAVKMKIAEYELKRNDVSGALGHLQNCKELIQRNTEDFSSTEVAESPFYDSPRHIVTDILALDEAIYQSVTKQHHDFEMFCEGNNLTD